MYLKLHSVSQPYMQNLDYLHFEYITDLELWLESTVHHGKRLSSQYAYLEKKRNSDMNSVSAECTLTSQHFKLKFQRAEDCHIRLSKVGCHAVKVPWLS